VSPPPWLAKHFWELLASAGLVANLLAWGFGTVSDDQSASAVLVTHAPPLVVVPPAVLVLTLTLVRRAARASAIAAVSTALALGPLGGFALPHPRPERDAGLSVFTYNVEKWSHGTRRVAEILTGARPDVFCLQEAGEYPYVPNNAEQLRDFTAALRDYRLIQGGELMIGTRLPVAFQRVTELPLGPASRPLLEVTVLGPSGAKITVFTAHLLYTAYFALTPSGLRDAARARLTQAEAILARASAIRGPLILCGDLNASRRSAAIRRLNGSLRDAWSERGFGFGLTLTSTFPTRRIDYVLVRDLDVQSVDVPDVAGSDHRPVLAVLGLPKASGRP
jgi:endonuclease/exonuclease/phosphatase (EEP) superfamily protein YafD